MLQENDTFGNLRFEAPKKGKKLEWVELADKNALEGLLKQEQKHQKYVQSLDFLARNIGIKKEPVIVGFDVSGISGDIKTISCVNFILMALISLYIDFLESYRYFKLRFRFISFWSE